MLPCPECGTPAKSDQECSKCGLVFSKWRPSRKHQRFDYTLNAQAVAWLLALPAAFYLFPRLYERATEPSAPPVAVSAEQIAAEEAAPGEEFEDWYPEDIAPPAGLRYPCALTPLPAAMEGVPLSHRRFLNHAASLLLEAARQNVAIQAGLAEKNPDPDAVAAYAQKIRELTARLRAEPVPESLRPLRDDLAAAFELETAFFGQAYEQRRAGVPLGKIMSAPEKAAANLKLVTARARLKGRYPRWDDRTKEALYHHLCAVSVY